MGLGVAELNLDVFEELESGHPPVPNHLVTQLSPKSRSAAGMDNKSEVMPRVNSLSLERVVCFPPHDSKTPKRVKPSGHLKKHDSSIRSQLKG